MFSPRKAMLPTMGEIAHTFNMARYVPKFTGNAGGAYPLDPLKYLQMPEGEFAGSKVLTVEQRMSGINATLWVDPSFIL